ncbi:MAG: FAA hydrolase family protein [Calditrichaeota bacterium]|nr:MAG: FAA hydrolase family protein [Calditrichota bacterium]
MTKVFSYLGEDNLNKVGVEWRGVEYNFTQSWEMFKEIKLDRTAPSFPLVQLIIEMDLFYKETFDELFETLLEYRKIDDLRIRGHRKFLAPIMRPPKIIGIGRNYAKHAKELGNQIPKVPVFFSKPSSSIIASGDPIRIPAGVGRVDYEGELAFVISKNCTDVSAAEAMEYVAGYTQVNDVTARTVQKEDKEKGLPWFRSKGYDTFCPMGPYLIPAGCVENPDDLDLLVNVNGEVKQQGSTKDMMFKIPQLVEYLSKCMTLFAGDVIATGTPEGVGPIVSGDTVEVKIDDWGILRNRVV